MSSSNVVLPTPLRPTIATVDGQGRIIQTDLASPTETRVGINPDGSNVGTSEPATFVFAPASGVRAPGADYFGYNGRQLGDLQTSLNYTGDHINTFSDYDGALHVDYRVGGVTLTSITDYKINKKQLFVDLTASPVNVGAFQTRARTESLSQELRLAGEHEKLRWTMGAYFLGINSNSTRGLGAPAGSFLSAAFGLDGPGVDISDVLQLRTRSTSLFGQAEYEFVPKWTIVMGVRGILEHQKYDFASVAEVVRRRYSRLLKEGQVTSAKRKAEQTDSDGKEQSEQISAPKVRNEHGEAVPQELQRMMDDVGAAVRNALEEPIRFPPLRRALTPDDHVVVVVSDPLARAPELLSPLLVIRMKARPDHRAGRVKYVRSPPTEKKEAATPGGTDDRKDQ